MKQPVFFIDASYDEGDTACVIDLLAVAVGQTRILFTTHEQEATAYVGIFGTESFDARKDTLTDGQFFRRPLPIYLIDDNKGDVRLITAEAYSAGLTFSYALDITESTPLVENGLFLQQFRFVFPTLDKKYTIYSVDLVRATAVLDESLPDLSGAYEVEQLVGTSWVHLAT